MRPRPHVARVATMPDRSRRISLEVDEEEGPLHGRLAEAGGPVREFDGWLGLLTVLGRLLDHPSDPGDGPPSSSTPHH